jgi:hypothetical protein
MSDETTKRIGAGIAAAAGCLGGFVFWWIVAPQAFAFIVTEPDLLRLGILSGGCGRDPVGRGCRALHRASDT